MVEGREAAGGLHRILARDDTRAQLVWYLVVALCSLSADLLVFTALLATGCPVLLALVVGFVIGTLANYVLSRTLAFTGGRFRRWDEILRLFAVSLVGLGLTALLVTVFMRLGLSAIAAKLVATLIVFFWNYLGRRLFVFHSDIPLGSWQLSTQAIERVRASDVRKTAMTETARPADPRAGILALRERYRDAYRAKRDPIADERLLWRAQSLRHLVHLTPGQTILELGAGDLRFTRQLVEVGRGENPVTAARFEGEKPPEVGPPVEIVQLDALPGALAGRTFDVIVGLDLLDARECTSILSDVLKLLAPGGQVVFFESNPWNPWLKLKRVLARWKKGADPRTLLSRPRLYEMLSEVGFIRVFAVYTDFVYAPLTPRMIWALRNISIIAENTPGLRQFAGTILLHAQRPPRLQFRQSRSLCDHPALRHAVSVVIPCHNEEMNIGPLIDRLLELYGDYIHEIIPVDDNSRDGTGAVMASYAAADMRVRPVYRRPPNGVGRAIRDGYAAATGEWVLSMDCDFQHLLPEMREMFDRASEGSPVVVGSRFSRHSILLNYPLTKIVANRGFHLLASIVMGRRFRDVTNNLKLLRRDVVERLLLKSPGFAVNAETGLLPILMGYPWRESPISWINRSFDMGHSSFKLVKVGSGYVEVLWNLFRARTFGSGPYSSLSQNASHRPDPVADG
jgi:dolichol-phosphate mannosyltransferase